MTLDHKTVWALPYYVGPNDRLIVWQELNAKVRPPVKGGCDMKAIIEAVSWIFAVPCEDLLSTRRPANVSRARQVCCYLGKRLTSRSLPKIGSELGGRDHTTVLHGIIRIEALREVNDELNKMIFKCEVILHPSETLP